MSILNLRKSFHSYLSFPCFLILCLGPVHLMAKEIMIPIGVVLDFNSAIGRMANSCIWMAYHDFYKKHPHYQTRLDLRSRDSEGDIITAASTASDLMKEKVRAIIGPQRRGQARYVIELGRKHHVPIISFSVTSPSLSPIHSQIFIRTAQDDSSQVKAIAAIAEAYGWREIIPIYEDTEYGNGLIPYLTDALEEVDTRVPYRSIIDPNSKETQILEELKKLKHNNSTKIFLVHMTPERGSKLFSAAKKAGMMREGYAWIVTEGLSVELNPIGPEMMDSMQGVLGVRPKTNNTERLNDFKKRWKALSVKENIKSHLTIFGLWAYDTVWALAIAAEAQIANSSHEMQNATLLNTVLATKFPGLSGYFNLIGGQLEPSVLEVFNVVGHKERVIGYWSQERGLFQDKPSGFAKDKQKLKQPIWPGYTTDQPPKLRIGIPVPKGFTGFLKLESKYPDNTAKFSGFVIDVFLEVMNVLPFPLSYEFIPLENSPYDEFLQQLKPGKLDALVADITIVYYRTEHVDFTLPYSESAVSMIVSMKHDRQSMWIFLKPLTWGLWLTTGAAFVLTGFVVWFLEHRSNEDFSGTPDQQLGMIFWFSFSTLVFAQRERLESNWSRFVLIVWVFVVLIITQSYTASLASMLTIESLRPASIDIKEIKNKNYFVGHHSQSFVKMFLINQLGFNESQLKAYNGPEEYSQALSNGTNNGGVAAIFDEIPYINLFLKRYGSRFAMVGPTYKTDGMSFAFPLKSPLVSYFSRAILNVTENKDKFEGIKNKYFSSEIISKDQSASITSDTNSQSLTVYSFAGLFIVTAVASLLSLLFYLCSFLYSQWPILRTIHSEQTSFWSMVIRTVKHFDRKDSSLDAPTNRIDSRVHCAASQDRGGASLSTNGIDRHLRTHSHSEEANAITLNEDI